MRSVVDSSIVFLLEPFHSVIFSDFVLGSDSAFASSAEADSASGSLEDHVEVHTEDTGEGVVLDSQIDVLLDTESEASAVREIDFLEFSVLDLEASLQDLVGLLASDGHMHGHLFVSFNTETSDCVFCSGRDWLLPGEILQHFAG